MAKIKKGVLFSLSILLLASALLYLVASVSNYVTSLGSATSTLSGFERVGSQFDSASYGIQEISKNSGIDVSFDDTNLTLEMDTSLIENYFSESSAFAQFVQAYSRVNTTITNDDGHAIRLKLLPQNIDINYSATSVNIRPKSISGSADNVRSYEVLIKMPTPTPKLNWTQLSELPSSDPNAIRVRIALQGTNGTAYTEKYLDRHSTSSLDFLNAQNQSMMRLTTDAPTALTLSYNLDTYLKIIVGLNNKTEVELEDISIGITLDPQVQTSGRVILGES